MASLINDVEHPQLSKEMRGPNANVRPGVYSRTLVEEIKNQIYNVLLTKKRVKTDEEWSLAQKQRVFEQEVRPLLNSPSDHKTHEDLMKSLSNELISDIKENFTKTKSYLIDPSILGGTYLREENEKKNRKHFEIRSFIDVDNTVTGIRDTLTSLPPRASPSQLIRVLITINHRGCPYKTSHTLPKGVYLPYYLLTVFLMKHYAPTR